MIYKEVEKMMEVVSTSLGHACSEGIISRDDFKRAIRFLEKASYPEIHQVGPLTIERILGSETYRVYQTEFGPGAFFSSGLLHFIIERANQRLDRLNSDERVRLSRDGKMITEKVKIKVAKPKPRGTKSSRPNVSRTAIKLFN